MNGSLTSEPVRPAGELSIFETSGVMTRHMDRLLKGASHPVPVPLGGSPHVNLPAHVRAAPDSLARSSYVDSRGMAELRQAICESLATEGIGCSAEQVLVSNGAMHGLEIVFGALLREGDGVLMPQPGYFIHGLVERLGATLQTFPSPESDAFRPDWEAARRAVTESTRILYINTPVNPTGYVYSDDDLESAWRLASDYDLTIVSDESYSHFAFSPGKHRSIGHLDPARRRTIIVRSFSKDYALSGWRLGFLVLPAEQINAAAAHLEWTCLCVGQAAQLVGIAALNGPQDWVTAIAREAERSSSIVAPRINKIPGLRTVAPQGGLNVLVAYEGDVEQLVRHCVSEMGLAIQPGSAFGAPDSFRFQFGGTKEAIYSGLDRLELAVNHLDKLGEVKS
jgi:aspartate aminotransferase